MNNKEINESSEEVFSKISKKHKLLYRRGKMIIYTIITVGVVMDLMRTIFLGLNFQSLIASIILYIALLWGKSWARYYLATIALINILVPLYLLVTNMTIIISVPIERILLIILHIGYCITCTILLFCSKSVAEFMYIQENR